jgi:hypothetical protein
MVESIEAVIVLYSRQDQYFQLDAAQCLQICHIVGEEIGKKIYFFRNSKVKVVYRKSGGFR